METDLDHSADELGNTIDVEGKADNTFEDSLNIKSLECLEPPNGKLENSLNLCQDRDQNFHGNNDLEVG